MPRHRGLRWILLTVAVASAVVLAVSKPARSETPGQTILISAGTTLGVTIDSGLVAAVNGDGSIIAFTQLRASGDESLQINAIVADRTNGTVEIIAGTAFDGTGSAAVVNDISADGRYITLYLVAPVALRGQERRIAVYDRGLGTMSTIVTGSSGLSSPVISDDGRFVAFQSTPAAATTATVAIDPVPRVIIADRGVPNAAGSFSGDPEFVANIAGAFDPAISGNGQWVGFARFETSGPDLVPPPTLPTLPTLILPLPPTFTLPLQGASTLSGPESVVQSQLASAAGFGVAQTLELPMVSVFVHSVADGTETELTPDLAADEFAVQPSLAADGRFVALTVGRSGAGVESTRIVRIDRDLDGDGIFDEADDFTTVAISEPNPDVIPEVRFADSPAISDDGETVAFAIAGRLVSGDTNFDRDFINPQLTPLVAGNLLQGSFAGSIVVNRVVSGFTLDVDVYVRDVARSHTGRISVGIDDGDVSTGGDRPSISSFGRFVGFHSTDLGRGPALTAGDDDTRVDVFLRDRIPQLVIQPNPVDFGEVTLGSAASTVEATVRNLGVGAARIPNGAVTIDPPSVGFSVVSQDCTGALFPGAECTIRVAFEPVVDGPAFASLRVENDSPVNPVTARLIAVVTLDPILKLTPETGRDGFVPVATGANFVAGNSVELRWKAGTGIEDPVFIEADAAGMFDVGILVFPNSYTGERVLEAVFDGVVVATADYLVTQNTADPFGDDSFDLFRG